MYVFIIVSTVFLRVAQVYIYNKSGAPWVRRLHKACQCASEPLLNLNLIDDSSPIPKNSVGKKKANSKKTSSFIELYRYATTSQDNTSVAPPSRPVSKSSVQLYRSTTRGRYGIRDNQHLLTLVTIQGLVQRAAALPTGGSVKTEGFLKRKFIESHGGFQVSGFKQGPPQLPRLPLQHGPCPYLQVWG